MPLFAVTMDGRKGLCNFTSKNGIWYIVYYIINIHALYNNIIFDYLNVKYNGCSQFAKKLTRSINTCNLHQHSGLN